MHHYVNSSILVLYSKQYMKLNSHRIKLYLQQKLLLTPVSFITNNVPNNITMATD